jgi:hypothetical protein
MHGSPMAGTMEIGDHAVKAPPRLTDRLQEKHRSWFYFPRFRLSFSGILGANKVFAYFPLILITIPISGVSRHGPLFTFTL